MKEVADRAGVAISSVSRVLSGHDVSQVMRNRVLDAVAALGYEPDILAQSMRTGATMMIGFVVSDISNPLIAEIALGAEMRLRDDGYSMIVVNSMNEHDLELDHIAFMKRRRADGLLLSLANETRPEIVAALDRLDLPVVLVDRQVKGFGPGHMVLSNHGLGMGQAVERLYDLGHRSIALINGTVTVRPSRERAATVRSLAKSRPGLVCAIRSGAFTADHGESATRELVSSANPPTAIISGSNQILVGVLRALRDLEWRVPRDISLVTCDDSPLGEFMTPALDTIRRDPAALGRQAADNLVRLLKGEPTATITLPTEFLPRASSAAPPTARTST